VWIERNVSRHGTLRVAEKPAPTANGLNRGGDARRKRAICGTLTSHVLWLGDASGAKIGNVEILLI
jgi:hypothetical protein